MEILPRNQGPVSEERDTPQNNVWRGMVWKAVGRFGISNAKIYNQNFMLTCSK